MHESLKFCYTLIARSAWKNQFVLQRRTFQRKFSEFWLNTVESQHTNPRRLWRVVNDILKLQLEVQTKNLSVDDVASHFHNKIAGISRSTANAPPVTVEIVINFTRVMGVRVTLGPAGLHCPSWEDAFVSSSDFYLS